MNDKTAKKNTDKVKTVSCKCSDHQGDLVKDDLPVWIIGTDVKHIRVAQGMGGHVDDVGTHAAGGE